MSEAKLILFWRKLDFNHHNAMQPSSTIDAVNEPWNAKIK